ncbi:hypothetical protein [Arenimonas sp.]|uniref:hypothetical protein n=1 Tax=Arenimonas sp. TaxID=1872635 RepID=UPI0035B43DA7
MNHPQDPRKDPLQDDEVALARVLRALPGNEPSPPVDAAILAAARNATAPSQTHRRRGLPGWALGTAAAAVLAVGIGLQLQPSHDAQPEGVTADAPAPQAKPQESPARRLPASPPPPPPAAPPAPPVPRAPPRAVAPEPIREAEAAAARSLADEARSLESSAAAERARAQASPSEARGTPVQEAADAAGAAPPAAFSQDDVLPPVDEDARLGADDWLERIRERVRQGDRAGARASLQRFERAHPDVMVPPDLAAFRS